MTPALHIRMSRRGFWSGGNEEMKAWTPALTDAREARSISRKMMGVFGCLVFRSEMRVSAREAERPVKKMRVGLWVASETRVCVPRPAVPVMIC